MLAASAICVSDVNNKHMYCIWTSRRFVIIMNHIYHHSPVNADARMQYTYNMEYLWKIKFVVAIDGDMNRHGADVCVYMLRIYVTLIRNQRSVKYS